MPKARKKESESDQAERFRKTVQDLIDAGELNPTEAEERFERAVGKVLSGDKDS